MVDPYLAWPAFGCGPADLTPFTFGTHPMTSIVLITDASGGIGRALAQQVADVMAWLLGDGAARLTGQVIAVDGGFTTVRPLVK